MELYENIKELVNHIGMKQGILKGGGKNESYNKF